MNINSSNNNSNTSPPPLQRKKKDQTSTVIARLGSHSSQARIYSTVCDLRSVVAAAAAVVQATGTKSLSVAAEDRVTVTLGQAVGHDSQNAVSAQRSFVLSSHYEKNLRSARACCRPSSDLAWEM
ncbi:hypothetical protein ElyMa_001318400 [Elysia marginata]|uniref:Uncharacterized protein n=1 Tax=Elysia marginata TaxID=1093978 RepID=A0AAV4ILI4_9GAST|nr:hypothetical protein ElyMa_001318400 [Elysia marginata]